MSIFNEQNKVQSNWMKFQEVGDRIEGTLIAKRPVFNQLSGKDQIIYEIKKSDGSYWNVGGKPGIDAQMQKVRLGQVVGFEFITTRKPGRPGLNPTKVIQVYANPDIVDEEWLQQHEDEINAAEESQRKSGAANEYQSDYEDEESSDEEEDEGEIDKAVDEFINSGGANSSDDDEEDDEEDFVSGETPEWKKEEYLEKISQLAEQKLGPSKSGAEVKEKVMEATGLAFIVVNFQKIIDRLRKLPDKKTEKVKIVRDKIIKKK